ncbi:hypothetical protein GGR57DRAFT_435819 [Xylariaceae sp. FL1272]|nr:hypothetical protein GGR57DRAFT_435819 [Xylariaceae sp. FL1272]
MDSFECQLRLANSEDLAGVASEYLRVTKSAIKDIGALLQDSSKYKEGLGTPAGVRAGKPLFEALQEIEKSLLWVGQFLRELNHCRGESEAIPGATAEEIDRVAARNHAEWQDVQAPSLLSDMYDHDDMYDFEDKAYRKLLENALFDLRSPAPETLGGPHKLEIPGPPFKALHIPLSSSPQPGSPKSPKSPKLEELHIPLSSPPQSGSPTTSPATLAESSIEQSPSRLKTEMATEEQPVSPVPGSPGTVKHSPPTSPTRKVK